MNKRELKVWHKLIENGWEPIDRHTLALGNLTFAFDEFGSGAIVLEWDRPWRLDNEYELIARYPIWLNFPKPIKKVIGSMSIRAVIAQIDHAVAMSCGKSQTVQRPAEVSLADGR